MVMVMVVMMMMLMRRRMRMRMMRIQPMVDEENDGNDAFHQHRIRAYLNFTANNTAVGMQKGPHTICVNKAGSNQNHTFSKCFFSAACHTLQENKPEIRRIMRITRTITRIH